jgi:hypothetical protein
MGGDAAVFRAHLCQSGLIHAMKPLPTFFILLFAKLLQAEPPKSPAKPDAPAAKADQPAAERNEYVRFAEHDDGDSLETAVARFVSPKGVVVDLVGAVHIADKTYFEALNARFQQYDALLYELVGPPISEREKGKSEKGSDGLQWIGKLQGAMRDALKLSGQLEHIDYHAKNFVHADMSLAQFQKLRQEKQEGFLQLYLRVMSAYNKLAEEGDDDPEAASLALIVQILINKDDPVELKRAVAGQFEQVERLMHKLEEGEGTVIIGERNRVAFEVLDRELAAGKKKLGIFYGAGHLPDMEKRLLERGFKKVKTEWMRAWWMPYGE